MITATVRYKLPSHIDYAACRAHIVERYGMHPHIEFYDVFALTDSARGTVELFASPEPAVLTAED